MAATLYTIMPFNSVEGSEGGLLLDSSGDLFGVTLWGGTNGEGMVFELQNAGTVAVPSYSATPTFQFSLSGVNGDGASGGLYADTHGDLFGTSEYGGPSGSAYGPVFEIQNTGTAAAPVYSAPTALFSANGTSTGSDLQSPLTADSNGNLFTMIAAGGDEAVAGGFGEVLELVKTGQTTASEASVKPFSTATIGDANSGATETLTIASGDGGTLTGNGLTIVNGADTLSGTAAQVTAELDALSFKPSQGVAGNSVTTIFTLTDLSSAGSSAVNSTTTVKDTDPAATLTSFALTAGTGGTGTTPYYGALTMDASGDLFGTTYGGGANGFGAVFELQKSGATYTLVAKAPFSFTPSASGVGYQPYGGLIDVGGNFFGTTYVGGSGGSEGTVFELTPSGSTLTSTTLLSFNSTNLDGYFPEAGLVADSNGDLFGTAYQGGTSNVGTIYELKNAGTPANPIYTQPAQFLVNLTNTAGADPGAYPLGGLTIDANGDLFGTTYVGGTSSVGTAFEVKNEGTAAAPSYTGASYSVLYDFTGTSGANAGAYPYGGLVADANGNLFGTTYEGGTNGIGAVFEIKNTGTTAAPTYTGGATFLASFASASGGGYEPKAGLIVDANGDLFGTTYVGGASGYGAVFELKNTGAYNAPNYANSTIDIVYSFTGASTGYYPEAPLTADASGDLFGTTSETGNGYGTAFELKNVGFVVPPTIAGTVAGQTTTSEAQVSPFASVTIGDANSSATDTLTIQLSGGGGALADGVGFSGLTSLGNGAYALTGASTALTSEFDALKFTPTAAGPGGSLTTTFTLTDVSSAGGPGVGDASTTVTDSDPPCYCRGTRIATERGEIAVEALVVGDRVLTETGTKRPIQWLGYRSVDCLRHPDPSSVWPICVRAGAFGDDRPSRDLWLSPFHSVAVDGVLMQIQALQNGRSIFQQQRSSVEYWHVELDAHDILLADGMPAESYLDQGNRSAFVNGGAFVDAHPDFKPRHWSQTCLPLVLEGTAVVRTRQALLTRLESLGQAITTDADLHLMADGQWIEPIDLGGRRRGFALPADCQDIRLTSRSFVPAHTGAQNADARLLGVCVGRLQIDGEDIALDRDEALGAGWQEAEREHGEFARRWTKGEVSLRAGARFVIVDLAGDGYYWRVPEDEAASPVTPANPADAESAARPRVA